jgi:hypothetical protein
LVAAVVDVRYRQQEMVCLHVDGVGACCYYCNKCHLCSSTVISKE